MLALIRDDDARILLVDKQVRRTNRLDLCHDGCTIA